MKLSFTTLGCPDWSFEKILTEAQRMVSGRSTRIRECPSLLERKVGSVGHEPHIIRYARPNSAHDIEIAIET